MIAEITIICALMILFRGVYELYPKKKDVKGVIK